MVKTSVAWWPKFKWDVSVVSVLDIFKNSSLVKEPSYSKKAKNDCQWFPFRPSRLKFNVDRAFRGCLGNMGISGVVRYHEGRIKFQFLKVMG